MFTFIIPDMSCGHCAAAVTKAVKGVDPDARVDVDLAAHAVAIATSADAPAITRALDAAGYPAQAQAQVQA